MVKTDATTKVMSRKGTAMKRSALEGGATRAGDAKEKSIELPDGMGERIAKKAQNSHPLGDVAKEMCEQEPVFLSGGHRAVI